MRKTTGLLIILFLMVSVPNVVFGQDNASDAFKTKFPKLGGELKPEAGKTVEPAKVAAYRAEYVRLADGLGEIDKFINKGATKENLTLFDYATLKDLEKNKQLEPLKVIINKNRYDLKVMMKDQTKYGIDSLDALQHISMMMDLVKQKDYVTAYKPWSYLYHYYPISSKNIYIKASKILGYKFKSTIATAKEVKKKYDESNSPEDLAEVKRLLAEKNLWIDTLFMSYDQRIKYYGDAKKKGKGYVLIEKGIAMYKYRKKDTIQTAYKVLGEGMKLEGDNSKISAFQYYFKMSAELFRSKKHEHGADKVVDDYTYVTESLGRLKEKFEKYITRFEKEGKAKKVEKYKKYLKATIDVENAVTSEFLKKPSAAECEHLVPAFTPRYEADSTNVELLNKIAGMLVKQKCTTEPLFERVAVQLYTLEPSANSAFMLAQLYLKKDPIDFAKVAEYYKEAYTQEKDTVKLAKYYYGAAVVANQRGKKGESRTLARKALKYDANMGKAYILIASMYGSTSGCGDAYQSRFVYSAAIDKLNKAISVDPSVKADASKMIGQYRSRLPERAEVFMQGETVGGAKKVGCWIGETTTIRTRD